MKIFRYLFAAVVALIVVFMMPTAEAIDIADINDRVVEKIQLDFKSSLAPTKSSLSEKPNWSCQLYGMRSRLQTTKKADFYRFSPKIARIDNGGSQIIRSYTLSEAGLKGNNGPIVEVIRKTKDGRLIGEMALKVNRADKSRSTAAKKVKSIANTELEVIAYSVCN